MIQLLIQKDIELYNKEVANDLLHTKLIFSVILYDIIYQISTNIS